jgi:hypothetical protein
MTDDADARLLDYTNMDVKDRFVLMLVERVQALEGCVAALEQEASTDSMSVTVEASAPLDVSSILDAMFGGGGGGVGNPLGGILGRSSTNWAAHAAAFGRALRSDGVDVSEVIVSRRRRHPGKRRSSTSPLMESIDSISTTMPTMLTVRLRAPRRVRDVTERLVSAMAAMEMRDDVPARCTSNWAPTRACTGIGIKEDATWSWTCDAAGDEECAAAEAASASADTSQTPRQQPMITPEQFIGFATSMLMGMGTANA